MIDKSTKAKTYVTIWKTIEGIYTLICQRKKKNLKERWITQSHIQG